MFCIGECIIKYSLIIGNIVFSLAGLLIIGFGTAGLLSVRQISEIFPPILETIIILIIASGAVVFVISFLACCGACQQSICMLITYSTFVLILVAGNIYFVVYIFEQLRDAQRIVEIWISKAFNNPNLTNVFNKMESFFKCCGTTGANAYEGTTIPRSCCTNPLNGECNAQESYDGCTDMVTTWLLSFGGTIGIVFIIVLIIEVLCMIFALHVSNTIRNKRNKKIANTVRVVHSS